MRRLVAATAMAAAAMTWPPGDIQAASPPATVIVRNGQVTLHALLWRPAGTGPFPAVLFNHGSGRTKAELQQLGPYENNARKLGPVFARHGYVFLYLFRRGVGLSADQGVSCVDLMDRELAAHGQDARNRLQMQLLEEREMSDASAGLAFLRARPEVDVHKIALVGHSFGGSLTALMAARDPALRAIVIFSGAGYSWDRSPELRDALLASMTGLSAPAFFIHAANDYSVNPGKGLDAELERLGKPHRLEIYPSSGRTAEEGHDFPNRAVTVWERDVFGFLDASMRN